MDRVMSYDEKVIIPEPTCAWCGRLCKKNEVVWTGDSESYKGFELWCYCKHCNAETFHIIQGEK